MRSTKVQRPRTPVAVTHLASQRKQKAMYGGEAIRKIPLLSRNPRKAQKGEDW